MKMTRRNLGTAMIGSTVLGLKIARAQATPANAKTEENLPAAKEQIRRNSEALAKFQLPMGTEPAFQFKA